MTEDKYLFVVYRMCRKSCDDNCKSCGYFYGMRAGPAMNGKRIEWFKVRK